MIQVCWLFAVPPFAGVDEFDHTYRAAAVARGEWWAKPSDATRGTGALVSTPRDIVEAAHDECERLPYTKAAECRPSSDADMVRMPSGAGRYNPIFYFLVGTAALPFNGVTAHYVMRAADLVLCWLVVMTAFWVASRARDRWQRGWLLLGGVLAMTPVALFSTAMVAPNGLEIACGLAFWVAVLDLLRRDDSEALPSIVLAAYAVTGSMLLLLRSLGPLWALLIVLVSLVATRPPRARLRRVIWGSAPAATATAVLALSGLASVAWTRTQGSLTIGSEDVDPIGRLELLALVLKANIVWVFQAIAAFPTRVNLAPMPVYVAGLGLLFALLILMRRGANPHVRRATWVAVWLSILVPSVITYRTYADYSIAWQGRYTLPFAIGIVLLAASTMASARRRIRPDAAFIGLMLFVLMQTLGLSTMMARERRLSPGVADGAWVLVPVWIVTLLVAIGSAVLWATAAGQVPAYREITEERPREPQGADT
ncbi:DUF2142 domain-containing protein [Nocardioides marmoribigeumensis]|uniref:Effector of murein hydrolase LrgA (UPF0299 family) n=1 Tax=Nocardioides marmoribigeumensis TaxID=433649 RepID=A0ABU2BPK7_9ACTN|nr:DUF2142 domain-containing protein [Nocardioides marmoribigeumensis]MDR7360564.1 putative effector of murein hydrolase LrgA (UPF0299 family) [Nocardioides marmoribigeumensis]